jgi:DnaK suppressor protein
MPRGKQQDPAEVEQADAAAHVQANGTRSHRATSAAESSDGAPKRADTQETAGTKENPKGGVTTKTQKAKRPRPVPTSTTSDAVDRAGSPEASDEEPNDLYLEHQQELLRAERNNYTRQAAELKAQAEALALEHEPGDVQFDEEGGEGGTANVDRELDLHLSAQAQAAIEEIDAAMAKIAAGTYGFCESCGNPVPRARLEALPHARLCVSCKSGGLSARRQ